VAIPADDHGAASCRDAAAATLSGRIVSQRKRQVHRGHGEPRPIPPGSMGTEPPLLPCPKGTAPDATGKCVKTE
jgi:hypothetical protein